MNGCVSFEWGYDLLNEDSQPNNENTTDNVNIPTVEVEEAITTTVSNDNDTLPRYEENDEPNINVPPIQQQHETNTFDFDEDQVEQMLIDEMQLAIENNGDNEFLNDDNSDTNSQDDVFSPDKGEEDLLQRISQYENELEQQGDVLQLEKSSDYHAEATCVLSNTLTSDGENVDDLIAEGEQSIAHTRPRRANAGTGTVMFEPSWGSKEKKKCFLQMKQRERNTNIAKVTLMTREARKKAKNHQQFFQLAVNQVFFSAQMSARKGIK